MDRIIKDLNYHGEAYYISPYPKDVYLPEHLRGLKEMVVFLSAEPNSSMPSIEELSKSTFLLENNKGILVSPPGLGMLTKIEAKLGKETSKAVINELCETLPRVICDDLSLAKEATLLSKENEVNLRIYDSIYKSLYNKEDKLKSVTLLGSPIVSALAGAIAKSTGKPVTIRKLRISSDGAALDVNYHILESGERKE